MKIKIEFTQEEKVAIIEATQCPLTEDKKEGAKGKFGTFIYDPEGSIEIDLKSSFLSAYMAVITSAILLFKSFMVTFESFIKEWLEDVEHIDFEEKENSKEDLHCPVERLNKEDDEKILQHDVLTEETDSLLDAIDNASKSTLDNNTELSSPKN